MITSLRGANGPEAIHPPTIRPERTSVYAQYTVMVPNREALQKRLAEAGIPTAVHYPVPLNEQPAYNHLCCSDCTPVAQQMAKQVMSLPMGADLLVGSQKHILSCLN
jgi:UDP-2-acetamido-2-deoxy-ribo-hexuluronate aminotransferase